MSKQTKYIRSTLVLSVSVIALALTGCKHIDRPTQVAGWTLVDPKERHPILVSQEPTTLKVHAPVGSSGLNPRQRAEIMQFAAQFNMSDAGDGRLRIAVPSGSANEVGAMHAADDMRHILIEEGFKMSDIVVEAYYDDQSPQPPVQLSYTRYVAEGPKCGSFPTNLASQRDNVAYADFGCSTQRNFAAQLANPADLVTPRTMTARSSNRRDAIFKEWFKGKTTASERSQDERITNNDFSQ